jgi:hypothetical protein
MELEQLFSMAGALVATGCLLLVINSRRSGTCVIRTVTIKTLSLEGA